MRRVGQARRHLVHDAAANAGVVDLGALRHLRDLDVVDRDVEEAAQRAQRRDLERGARRQADAHRQLGRDVDVERRDRMAAPRDFLDAAEDVAAERLVGQAIEPEPKRPRQASAERSVNSSPTAWPSETVVCCASRDRQHEAVVVVGVLAEQVDAPGRAARRRLGERAAERVARKLARSRKRHLDRLQLARLVLGQRVHGEEARAELGARRGTSAGPRVR